MKDESLDAPIHYRTDDEYYKSRIEQEEENLKKLRNMGANEVEAYGKRVKQEIIDDAQEKLNELITKRNRYQKLLSEVESWNPNEFDYLKNFMREQLKITLDSDCSPAMQQYYTDEMTSAEKKKPKDIVNDAIALAERNLEYYKTQYAPDSGKIKESNDWINRLHDYLGVDRPSK
ncbi:MAG: hypothetical protein CMO34_07850 [Verrucomicrobia bacterium]|nr:hypothetical protein [Verrucomicrobiota bacterium]